MKVPLLRIVCLLGLVGAVGCRVQRYPPELLRVAPSPAFAGQTITLGGFQFGTDPTVTVAGVLAKVTGVSDQSLTVIVPLVAPGPTTIRVQNAQGTTEPLPFTVQQPAPTLTGVSPANGLPGAAVVLTGTYLNQLRSVRFGNVPAVVRDSSVGQLTVLVPANLPLGPLTLTVDTKGGTLSTDFLVAGTPQITDVSPRLVKVGSSITIRGKNLTGGVVSLNGRPTSGPTSVTDTLIRTIVPGDATSGRLQVTTFGRLTTTSTDTLVVAQPPGVGSASPAEGIAGDKVQLYGKGFSVVSDVTFGGVSAPFRVVSYTQLDVTVPSLAQSGTVEVAVSNVGGRATLPFGFLYYAAPAALAFNPGRVLPGAEIVVTGKNLYRITEVRLNNQAVPISNQYEGRDVRFIVPNDAAGGLISVVNRAGTATSATALVVVRPAVITGVSPTTATAGTNVSITGQYLDTVAEVRFNGGTSAPVPFRLSGSLLIVTVPTGATTGTICLINEAGTVCTTGNFTVTK